MAEPYSPYLHLYDGLGDPGYKHMRTRFSDYLEFVSRHKEKSDADILLQAAERIEQLEDIAGIEIEPPSHDPYAYYPTETQEQ